MQNIHEIPARAADLLYGCGLTPYLSASDVVVGLVLHGIDLNKDKNYIITI